MKNLILGFSLVAVFGVTQVCGCGVCQASARAISYKTIAIDEPKEVTLRITGISCAGCSNHIHTSLSKTVGIISDDVKYPGDIATVKYDASKISEKEIIAVIENAGYKAEIIKQKIKTQHS
ncbi:heavy-metal-associated domain-containing protein [Mucilaginibacter gossypii]|uniref:heavy-metal-associated domain-containing protein n=1 Tax=Mucilaginibacter gossypii TaxID=551996 RepID=UPI000DCECFB9|nr:MULTISPECIES: heavy-metal-associated domain-containing protein [Mucilaginibacter]QTE35817.1 heavy-metal-associated domain-containing protein [Mucilaginibacter gossypii]RAV54623.1 copper chaperone [Mucilaginibacter rubeus]